MNFVSEKNFKRFINIVLVTVYALILIGGIVRSTGSGLGCPDWPTCFGKIVPPTHVSELPLDYKTKFAISGKEIADFNAVKTWTEYLNRLFGMLTGFFILILAIMSFAYRKSDKRIFRLSIFNLFAVIFQGWLGAVVVSTHLKPVIITAHMVMAIFIVFILLQTKKYINEKEAIKDFIPGLDHAVLKKYALAAMGLTLIQVVLGTQVREAVDHVAKAAMPIAREFWVSKLGLEFLVHRSYSIVLVVVHIIFTMKLLKLPVKIPKLNFHAYGMLGSLAISILSGISLSYFDFPASMQPLHLLAAVMLMGFQYTCFCDVNLHKES
ncbi:COX15/CtaA family protein [Halobacteriovorax sp. GB3]|uniref:COX15/CtaA family protein n=1 Tax=Halobacteriovorax sp. GB3 TaxID=2719615 RepID=UPI00235EAE22|nr:COX15/CtaA family protein [Halobacteriovorax sp. GB3]MDD0854521.1 COX15/CtaA family protein [Halobacteriovorax sp. GB3]